MPAPCKVTILLQYCPGRRCRYRRLLGLMKQVERRDNEDLLTSRMTQYDPRHDDDDDGYLDSDEHASLHTLRFNSHIV